MKQLFTCFFFFLPFTLSDNTSQMFLTVSAFYIQRHQKSDVSYYEPLPSPQHHPGWEVMTSTAPPHNGREHAANSRVHFFSASQSRFCLTASNDHLKTPGDNTPTHTLLPVHLKYQHRWKATDVKPTSRGLACNTQQWALFSKLGKSRVAEHGTMPSNRRQKPKSLVTMAWLPEECVTDMRGWQ